MYSGTLDGNAWKTESAGQPKVIYSYYAYGLNAPTVDRCIDPSILHA
jgi:hypothetical protein